MASRGPRLTIPTRIFLSIVLVLLFFGAASGASLYQHQRSAQRLHLLEDGYLPLAMSISRVRASQAVFSAELDRLLDGRAPANARWWLDGARRVRPAGLERAMARLRRAKSLNPPAEDATTLAEIEAALQAIRAGYAESEEAFEQLYDAREREDEGQAQQARTRLREGEDRVVARLRHTWLLVQSRVGAVSRTAAEQEQQSVWVFTGMAFVAMLVGLIVLFWTHGLLAPLPLLQKRVEAVARGELEGAIGAARDDEIGQLTEQFERMVDAVAARDKRLREAAENLRGLQEMQEQIVAGLRAGVIVVDAEGVVRTANRAAEAVLSIASSDVDVPLAELDLLERLPGLAEAIAEVAEGRPRASLVAAPLGSDRFVDVLVTPFGADQGSEGRRSVLVVADDVTDERRTKARLIQTERLAAIGRMAAHVTHEVRNPLSSIGLNVELLEDEVEDRGPEAKALVRSIQREIDRLTDVTEDYLRLARLPMPRLEPESLGVIVDEVGRFVARELEQSGVVLKVVVEPDLPLVAADEPQIRQALLNLLRNAKDSMPEGGEAEIQARRVDGGVAIRVRDRGDGIPEEARSHIFDLFYSTKDRGSGLGLPLTRQIVSAHGGTITCDEAEEGGTAFTMWFPQAQVEEPTSELAARPEGC